MDDKALHGEDISMKKTCRDGQRYMLTKAENTYHVRLVDPHTKGYGSTDDLNLPTVPLFLDTGSLTSCQTSMVMCAFDLVFLPQEFGGV